MTYQRMHAPVQVNWDNPGPAGSDTVAYQAGNIAIAPLKVDWTAYELLETVSGWSLTTG